MAIMPTALQEMAFDCYLIFTCAYNMQLYHIGAFGTFVNKRNKIRKKALRIRIKGEERIEEVKIYYSHIYHFYYV